LFWGRGGEGGRGLVKGSRNSSTEGGSTIEKRNLNGAKDSGERRLYIFQGGGRDKEWWGSLRKEQHSGKVKHPGDNDIKDAAS